MTRGSATAATEATTATGTGSADLAKDTETLIDAAQTEAEQSGLRGKLQEAIEYGASYLGSTTASPKSVASNIRALFPANLSASFSSNSGNYQLFHL